MILYIYSLFIQSYLISLILTHSTLSAVSLICPFVKRAQTSFLPLFYQLSTAWIVRINRYQLLCGGFRFLPFFPSLRSTQFNASTRFPTCLRTFKSTKQAAFVLSSRMSMDSQAVLQYISHTLTHTLLWSKTRVLSSSRFLGNFSLHLFVMPSSN